MNKPFLFAGFLAPLVYLTTVVAGGWITPGYDHLAQPVSALFEAGAEHAVPISAAFLLYNILLLVFGFALLAHPGMRHTAMRVAAGMILLNGLFGVVIEWAPMDPQGAAVTLPGLIHMVLAGLLVLTCMLAMAGMAWGLRAQNRDGRFVGLTLLLLAAMLVFGALAAIAAAQNWPMMGLYQRITIGSYLVWIVILAAGALDERPDAARVSAL